MVLLQGLAIALDIAAALCTLVVFVKPDFVVGLLAWGFSPGSWEDGEPLDEQDIALLRRAVRRLRVPALASLAALSFGAGVLLAWTRVRGG